METLKDFVVELFATTFNAIEIVQLNVYIAINNNLTQFPKCF